MRPEPNAEPQEWLALNLPGLAPGAVAGRHGGEDTIGDLLGDLGVGGALLAGGRTAHDDCLLRVQAVVTGGRSAFPIDLIYASPPFVEQLDQIKDPAALMLKSAPWHSRNRTSVFRLPISSLIFLFPCLYYFTTFDFINFSY